MSNQSKRAKRAKLKAKENRLAKQKRNIREAPKGERDIELSPEVLAFFETLPHPDNEAECIDMIVYFLQSSGSIPADGIEDVAAVLFAMYQSWHSS